jgi:colanic acid biosynthesis glycosyl transferase WcaI
MLSSGWFTRALFWLEAFAYAKAARVSGISGEIVDAFRRKRVPGKKLILFPNGVTIPTPEQIPPRGRFRAKNGFAPDEFLAIYAGNLGVKQGLDILLDAAERLDTEQIRIVLCGAGAARSALEKKLQDRPLANVTMLQLYFGQDYRELLVDGDVSLITQQSGSGNAFFPSKLLVTLAHSSPVVTVADEQSALAKAVTEGGFGRNVLPGKPGELADMLRDLAQDRQELRRWGAAGRTYVERFEQQKLLEEFVAKLRLLAGS